MSENSGLWLPVRMEPVTPRSPVSSPESPVRMVTRSLNLYSRSSLGPSSTMDARRFLG
ncbi:hypothetical protein ES703_57072 [subsurface metagenome]